MSTEPREQCDVLLCRVILSFELETSYHFHRLLHLSLDDMILLDEYDATGTGQEIERSVCESVIN